MAQINKPTDYFETTTYTGTGSSLSISSLDFSPDWVWIKRRDAIDNHALFDSVRGATKILQSNVSNAEATVAQSVTSFDSNGFTVGTDGQVNTNTEGHVAWSWRGSDSSAVSNTDGSITSNVSASTTSGFSIVSYTGNGTAGATIGHGLGVAPSMIIAKRRSAVENWAVYHKSRGASKYINLDTTTAEQSSTSRWNGTEPTSSVFSVNTHGSVNGSGDTYIAYCFAEKKGFSKFGSYTGNGNADGTFVYTGMRPAFVIIKRTNSATPWCMWDNKRNTFNVTQNYLYTNSSDAEGSGAGIDIDMLSNGFKLKTTSGFLNTSGDSFIYMCFAENPLVTTGKIPATAR